MREIAINIIIYIRALGEMMGMCIFICVLIFIISACLRKRK